MKKIILPFIVLFATIVLSTLDARAQRIQMRETPDYVSQNGQTYVTRFLLSDHDTSPVIPPPHVTILGDDFIDMRATSCTFLGMEDGGFIYELRLEIGAAVDFGDAVNSHIRLTFDLGYNKYCQVDFWTVQAGLSVGSISPSSLNILFGEAPQKLTYSTSNSSAIRSVQWQKKVGSGNWADIPGAEQYSYYPGALWETTEFRVCATSTGSDIGYTTPVVVTVCESFLPGKILGRQTITPGDYPAPITSLALATGGSGPIAYQWQSSIGNSTWVDIPGATSVNYQPQALTVTTLFRRRAKSGPETIYSNTATISMKAPLAADLAFKPVANVVLEEDRDTRTKGLKTYEKVAVLGSDAAAKAFVERAFYYDYRGRIIQTVEKNHLGGVSRYSTQYDFVGNILKSHEEHISDGDSNQKLTEFTYDHRSRLLTEKTTLNNSDSASITYTYDLLGRLTGKSYDTKSELGPETITMAMIPVGTNIRGWVFRLDRANTSDVVYAPGAYIYPDGVVKLTTNNGLAIEAYTEDGDWIWSSMTIQINGNTRHLMDSGTWVDLDGLDQDTFTIPNDKDYIVTSNNLPAADWGWGFDRIVKAEGPAPKMTTETYAYNIQGWQTNKKAAQGRSELFSMNLHYYNPQQPASSPSYTGNITEWEWKHNGSDVADPRANTYAFTYDKLSRLTATKQYIDGVANDMNVEKGMNYDLNGNIQTLQRYSAGAFSDNFTYTYSGNQLTSIAGTTSGSYAYDANGNMTHDGPNNLYLTYNRLNLTEKVTKNGTTAANYSYLSDGSKLSATDAAGNGLVYVGSLVYKKQGNALTLESAGFSSGRFVASETSFGTTYSPNYFITDHLGSVRVVVDANGTVLERNDYYPYGMRWNGGELTGNRYRYNGKEWQRFLNVPYNDHGARLMDPRFRLSWGGGDPLAEDTPKMSPFAFCNNNPINAIDPDGCSTWVMVNPDGTYRVVGGDLEDDDMNIYVYSIQDGNLVRGASIGVTTSITSFYNSDKDGGTWATGSIINSNDNSGSTFLNDITGNNPTMLDDYIANARTGEKYDFKATNGTNQVIDRIDIYRGMPIGSNKSGQRVYSSARDIGNIAAGYIAGSNGMTWSMSRLAFDAYQSKVSGRFVTEGLSTQNAEYYGWRLGNSLPARQKLTLYGRSVAVPILKAEYQILQKIFK